MHVDAIMSYNNYMYQVIDSLPDALLVTSNVGKIKKLNNAAQQLFGFSEEELINQPISRIIDDDQVLIEAIYQHSYFRQNFQNFEVVCRTKTREKRLIAFSCSVIPKKIKGLEDIVYIGRDITARQHREQRTSTQYAITRILSESQSVKQAIPQILQSICQNLGWDLGELWTPSQYIGTSVHEHSLNAVLRCVEIWSSRIISVREFKAITWQTTYTPSVGLPGRIWIRHLPLWIQDITEDGDKRRSQPAAEAGLHAAFGFPILDDSEILGVMVFFSRDVQLKDKELLQMMGSIGSQIAQFIKRKQAENAFNTENNQNLNLRIGIHRGSVVARVIDLNKFTYDLWGDTINIASCMESQGIVGKIQVTENTYKSLRNEFLFEKRGEIEVQGKGKMTTYFLIGQKG